MKHLKTNESPTPQEVLRDSYEALNKARERFEIAEARAEKAEQAAREWNQSAKNWKFDCEQNVAYGLSMKALAEKAEAKLAALKEDALGIGKVLEDEGCSCDCDCDSDGHWSDCELCMGCRIEPFLQRIIKATEEDK